MENTLLTGYPAALESYNLMIIAWSRGAFSSVLQLASLARPCVRVCRAGLQARHLARRGRRAQAWTPAPPVTLTSALTFHAARGHFAFGAFTAGHKRELRLLSRPS